MFRRGDMPVFERPHLQSPGHLKLLASQHCGLCSSESLSVSQRHLKVRNVGSPPGKDLDVALKKWACPRQEV
jgi:hypothetical protein